MVVDAGGNVFTVGGNNHNAFKITPYGTITEIIDSTGDGSGNSLDTVQDIAVDTSGNVYVIGNVSHNAFKIDAPGTCSTGGTPCTITEIIDSTGDGIGNGLDHPIGIAVDTSGNVYVSSTNTSSMFKIPPSGAITEIIDSAGDGSAALSGGDDVAVDASGSVYVAAGGSNDAFKVDTPGTCSTGGTPCTISEIIDASGDGSNSLFSSRGVAIDADGNAYVTGQSSDNVFKIGSLVPKLPGVLPALSLWPALLLAGVMVALGVFFLNSARMNARSTSLVGLASHARR